MGSKEGGRGCQPRLLLRLAVAFERNRWWAEETARRGRGRNRIANSPRYSQSNLHLQGKAANSKVDLLTSVHQELFLLVDLDRGMSNERTEIGMSLSLHNLLPRCTQNGSRESRKRRAQAGSPQRGAQLTKVPLFEVLKFRWGSTSST